MFEIVLIRYVYILGRYVKGESIESGKAAASTPVLLLECLIIYSIITRDRSLKPTTRLGKMKIEIVNEFVHLGARICNKCQEEK